MAAVAEQTVPPEWTEEVLAGHVAEIVFDGGAVVEPECVLCQEAAVAGLWDRHAGDDDRAWLDDLKRRAAERHGDG